MTFAPDIAQRAAALIAAYAAAGRRIATAESCTGGLVAALLTSVPGSSQVLERGFVTYSDEAKTEMLGVPAQTIAAHGAVSAAVAQAMAQGALANARADTAIAITGVAGPGGGSEAKPVGLVQFGLAWGSARVELRERRYGDLGRDAVRDRAVLEALDLLERALSA